MAKPPSVTGIEYWLAEVRGQFVTSAPELLPLFDIYAGEALFGRSYIASDLVRLPQGASVLEVGAGSLLLSCQLVREGFDATALEPTGMGFSHFDRMRQIVLGKARIEGCCPVILNLPGEDLAETDRYDYAFSVNVMEHVDDVALVLANVGESLRKGARYRFTCPNYLFPYEPHFNIPTLFSKHLTGKILGKSIIKNQRVTDPAGTWASLNWITVSQVGRIVRHLQGFRLVFNRTMLVSTLERVVSDRDFAARRSPAMRLVLAGLVHLKIHVLLGLVPALFQPIMDCTIEKIDAKENS